LLRDALVALRGLSPVELERALGDFFLLFAPAPPPALDEGELADPPPPDVFDFDLDACGCDFLPGWVAIRSSVVRD
jgi:hypothetical protein